MNPKPSSPLLLLCLFVSLSVSAQKLPFKFGKVDVSDLEMKQCDFYPDATSMTLAEYGIINFKFSDDHGFQYIMDVAVRKKIFKITDADQGNVKIHTYSPARGSAEEEISSLRAFCHNLVNGKVERIKLDNQEYFKKRLNDYWVEISFAIPNIKEGSVIEYTYKKTSDYLYNLTTWDFQSDIPAAHSEIRFTIPEYFNYQISQVGSSFITEDRSDDKRETFSYKWEQQGAFGQVEKGTGTLESNSKYRRLVSNNIPPVEDEPYMNNRSDVISRLQFQLVSTKMPNSVVKMVAGNYEKFNSELLSSTSFGERLKHPGFVKNFREQCDHDSDKEKARAIYTHIATHFSWNKVYSFMSSDAGRQAYNQAEGSVADINLTLVTAFRALGLEAYPVILSTRGNGSVHPVYPSYEEFNYMLGAVKIDEKWYLCDASSKLPFGQIPLRCRNGQGWLVSEQGGQWIDMKTGSTYTEATTLRTEISAEKITTHITNKCSGYAALKTYNEIAKKNTGEYGEDLANRFSDVEMNNLKVSELELGEPVKMEYDISKENDDSDILYIQPVLTGSITENPFKREERRSVIDFPYEFNFKVMSQIVVPEGYSIELPEQQRIVLPKNGGSFTFSCGKNGNLVTVVSQVRIIQNVFTPAEYPVLKQFYQIIADKNQEPVVLSR